MNPYDDKKNAIRRWASHAITNVEETDSIIRKANDLSKRGFKNIDSLHIACSIEGLAEFFITTDNGILNKADMVKEIVIISPVLFINVVEEA